jgi:hypothetical protein
MVERESEMILVEEILIRNKKLAEVLNQSDSRTCIWNLLLSKLFGKLSSNTSGMVSQEYYVFVALQKLYFKLPMDQLEKNILERKDWYKDTLLTMSPAELLLFLEFISKRMVPTERMDYEKELNALFNLLEINLRVLNGICVFFQNSMSQNVFCTCADALQRQGFEKLGEELFSLQLNSQPSEINSHFFKQLSGFWQDFKEKFLSFTTSKITSGDQTPEQGLSLFLKHTRSSTFVTLQLTCLEALLCSSEADPTKVEHTAIELRYIFELAMSFVNLMIALAELEKLLPEKFDLNAAASKVNIWGERL